MKCPRCQQENPPRAKFCLECGASFKAPAESGPLAASSTDLQHALSDALEQQAATSEILRVISSSPTDVQPVFDAIARSAVKLCDAKFCAVYRLDGELLHLAAHDNFSADALALLRAVFPRRPDEVSHVGRAVRERAVVNLADVAGTGDAPPRSHRHIARSVGYRGFLAMPILREGQAIGCIALGWEKGATFPEEQVSLVRTFADQAVIAVENVRLFNETKHALERQTATSEILRAISRAQTDVRPVFDTIAESALGLLGAWSVLVLLFDGEVLHLGAARGGLPDSEQYQRERFPMRLRPDHLLARCIVERAPQQDPDALAHPDPVRRDIARRRGFAAFLTVPMLRAGEAVGEVVVTRAVAGPFLDSEIALLQTFADQAVIAIENVRLFKELQARNQELTVALARQTATSEVLAVISGAQTDVQPVFETIVQNARRLCDASYGSVYRLDGQLVHLIAHNHQTPGAAEVIRRAWPMPLTGDSFVVRAIRENAVVHADSQDDQAASAALIARAKALAHRRALVVPMIREGRPIGAIRVSRGEATPFTEQHIALLKTFADQAVIAIENVRLFTELQARNLEIEEKSRQLEAASRHKSEFLANMSHELRTPLNAVIGFSEVLSEGMFGELNEKQEEYLKDIHASGQHLLSLINDILDLSKIEAGRMELELTDFDLPATLDNALTLVRERAGRHRIALHMTVDDRVEHVQADERKIKQVILNLLSNAIKFTPDGSRIDVRALPGDGVVAVSVSDTGVGIAPEDQEAIFEEFRQVGTAAKKVEGTGLGLALSRKFIELHGGRIWVESQVGVGSTFTFTIPERRGG